MSPLSALVSADTLTKTFFLRRDMFFYFTDVIHMPRNACATASDVWYQEIRSR